MGFMQRRKAFHALLTGPGCVHPASVFDPISARIAQHLGFACAMLAGSTAALAILGAPDNASITLSEFEDLATRIARAAEIPLLVDADHGYGNAHGVMRTVVELERAGVAAMTIEDTVLPQPFGQHRPLLTSRDEGMGKMRAAIAARTDPALVIVGRTSAIAIAGLDEAAARARLYAEAGVDALFFAGVTSMDELVALRAATDLPLILGGSPLQDTQALAARGVRISLQGHQPIQAAILAVQQCMLAQRDGAPLPPLADPELMARVTKAEQEAATSRAFLV